ncbi:MAG: class I SAM-dependent methyltransferase [Candidatus Ancaeobacter aquaticus]|nr:class I SAM-dependent methyltransferase [Candidatus Ancaeobacter aquaticus]
MNKIGIYHVQLKTLYHGCYSTHVYLFLSEMSRRGRRLSRGLRRKPDRFLRARLPEISWKNCTKQRLIKIWDHEYTNGNVRYSELGILAALAADCRAGSNLFEIGTFDGRTTLNLAMNAPAECMVYTLDLPPDLETKLPLASGEQHMIDKPQSGLRYEAYRQTHPALIGRVHQLLGDSAAFDYSPYKDTCSLIFVDGSHSYDYEMSDTRAAMDMVESGGVVIWHDYGIWEDVNKALEELDKQEGYGLSNISGTTLVYWRKP